jgi:hypothetical protein
VSLKLPAEAAQASIKERTGTFALLPHTSLSFSFHADPILEILAYL